MASVKKAAKKVAPKKAAKKAARTKNLNGSEIFYIAKPKISSQSGSGKDVKNK